MKYQAILFDLDGTLLPMDLGVFLDRYFSAAAKKLEPHGFEPEKFIGTLWKGSRAMLKNDGSETNEQAFRRVMTEAYGAERTAAAEAVLEDFYLRDFDRLKSVCGFDPRARETVLGAKAMGYRVALATNPLFPHVATESRIRWTGLSPEDFEFFTAYETSTFTKPSPGYYLEVTNRLGLSPQSCLMVGNDTSDDLRARQVGMDVFILTDNLINENGTELSAIPHGSFPELTEFLKGDPQK